MRNMSKKILEVTSAIYINDYKVKITFQDNTERVVDFHDFLKNSTNIHIQEFLDIKKFKSFSVHHGHLMWGDFELIFPIDELYAGKISS